MSDKPVGSVVTLDVPVQTNPETHRRVADAVHKVCEEHNEKNRVKVGDLIETRTVSRVVAEEKDGKRVYARVVDGEEEKWVPTTSVAKVDPNDPRCQFMTPGFTPESSDVQEHLAKAWFAYSERVKELLEPFTSEQLLAFAGDIPEDEYIKAWDTHNFMPRVLAKAEVYTRRLFDRAKPIIDAGGVYCVMHDADMRDCGSRHTEDEEWKKRS